MNASLLADFHVDMRLAALSARTINDRLAAVERLALWLAPTLLLAATADQLAKYQRRFSTLAPASTDIYTRHIQAFYRWAADRHLIDSDPAAGLVRPKLRRGRPHPTPIDDLRAILTCTRGPLRTAYVLASFAGLRSGEICRLRTTDLELGALSFARVMGKGDKERIVPLVEPIVTELFAASLPRSGYVISRPSGEPYDSRSLSVDSSRHLRSIGITTTLHSMRHLYATQTYRSTRDLLFLAELLGHSSVATTQIYAAPDMDAVHERMAGISDLAAEMLSRKLYAVS